MTGPLCPYCGAYSPRSCDFDGNDDLGPEDGDGVCPWDESGEYADSQEEDEDDAD